jgi:NADH-quinone oxidoreductase subunit N
VIRAAFAFKGPAVQWWALTPLVILVGGALALLVLSVVMPRLPKRVAALLTVAVAAAAITVSFFLWHDVDVHGARSLVSGAIALDGFSVFLTITICSAVLLTALVADDYLRREGIDGVEFYALLLLAAVGAIVMSSANDLVVLFLGLETLSIALYVLAGSHIKRTQSQESAIKYFVLGGFSSAFFLYGVALTYGATGSTNLVTIQTFLLNNVLLENGLLFAGFALMLVGLGFKVAAAPFHSWAPDVYEGAPTPVTGFMASAAKAAGFAALLRVFVVTFGVYEADWRPVIFVLALLTLVVGSLLAIVQTNVKRMLAYSSVSHAGFILVGVQAASAKGTAAAIFYLLAYTFLVVGTFTVVTLVARQGDALTSLDDFRGLGRRRPVLALLFSVLLLSQAGVPLTSGFMAKFQVIAAAVDRHSYALAIIAMLAAVIAAYLYLRVIVAMFLTDDSGDATSGIRVPVLAGVTLAVSLGFTVFAGVLPSPLLDVARHAVPVLAPIR